MANKPIAMNKLRSVLRLYTEGKSKVFISKYLSLSRNTVKKYIKEFVRLELGWKDIKKLSDRELYQLFHIEQEREIPRRMQELYAFFPYMQKELGKPGVTRLLLWAEYKQRHPDGYGTTQFSKYYNQWRNRTTPSMRIDHKAGDKMYVDYAGKKLQLLDIAQGKAVEVEVFVSILGASQLIYAEATLSQRKGDFITSVENALHYYGGVPAAIVPDNLKSAVSKSHRYEPTLNQTFADFAEHYGTTVLPARVYKPKDKALVEGAVKILYSAIYAAIRKQRFTNIDVLNNALWTHLEGLNKRKLNGRPFSRRELFEEIEINELKPLPQEKYEMKEYAWATVMKNGHVCLQKDKHYYSVPYHFIGKKVKLIWSSKELRVYYNYQCIASHKRVKSPYNYTTDENHLSSTHKFITQWNPDYFIRWATNISPEVEMLIREILDKKPYPEQAYRSCIGILGLAKKAGEKRLIAACTRALEYGLYNYKTVQSILEKGLDKIDDHESQTTLPKHNNIRGKDYYN